MKLTNKNIKNCLSICVLSALVVGCGESDLEDRFEEKIELADQNPPAVVPGSETPTTSADVVISETGNVATIADVPYDIVFGDEFNGTALDGTKWNTALAWGSDVVINEEEQYYVASGNADYNPFSFDGSALIITADETPAALSGSANGQPYVSGAITSQNKFSTTYGYIEMRAKMPVGAGLWSGFWMLGVDFVDLKPELFVVEHDGGRPDSAFHNYNYQNASGDITSAGQREIFENNLTTEFHTYGVQWDEGSLSFYIDGTPRYSIQGQNISSQAMYLIANLAVGGIWPGSPQGSTVFPAQMHIDYIRAYQKR